MQTFCCHIKILLNYLTKIVSTVFTHLHFFSFFTFLTCLSLLFYTSLPTSIPLCESPSKLSSFTLLYFVTYLHTFMWSLRTVLDLTTALTIIPLCESPSKFAFLYSSILHYLPENFSVNLPQNCPWLHHCTYLHTFVWIYLKTCFFYSSILHYLPAYLCVNLPQNCPWLNHYTNQHTFM